SVVDQTAINEIEWIKTFLLGVRRIRAERDIAPGKPLSVQVRGGNEQEQEWLSRNSHYIKTLGRIDSINTVDMEPDDAVIALAGDMTLLVPLADLIDPEVELERLQRELDRLDNDQQRIRKKLDNRDFVSRAPENVVNREKQRLEEATTAHAALMKQYERIKSLLQ
ncbi:MAG TPA: valine--tRNA ligase, partial [Gammaproteobacteria bacterium]|nr:valine--tRNA ligase [Gammaproteobacteria bacterium]